MGGESGSVTLLTAYLHIIEELARRGQPVPDYMVEITLSTCYFDAPSEHSNLVKTFGSATAALISGGKTPVARRIYSEAVEFCLARGMFTQASAWCDAASEALESHGDVEGALQFISIKADRILAKVSYYPQYIELMEKKFTLAQKSNYHLAAAEALHEIAFFQAKLGKSDAKSSYERAAAKYVEAVKENLRDRNLWKAALAANAASHILASELERRDEAPAFKRGDIVAERGTRGFYVIIGVRAAGVYSTVPSVCAAFLYSADEARTVLLIDLGEVYELVAHLNAKAQQYVSKEASLIGLLKRMQERDFDFKLQLLKVRYDNALSSRLYEIRGPKQEREQYEAQVKGLAERQRHVYLLPLATDDIKSFDVQSFSPDEIVRGIKTIVNALHPDVTIVTRPGFAAKLTLHQFENVSPVTAMLCNEADRIIVVTRADTQSEFERTSSLFDVITQKASWEFKTSIFVNRWSPELAIGKEKASRVKLEVPLLEQLGVSVENDRIPYIDMKLGLFGSESAIVERAFSRAIALFQSDIR